MNAHACLLLSLALSLGHAHAEIVEYLDNGAALRYIPSESGRVGQAVLVTFLYESPGLEVKSQLFAACDKSWISEEMLMSYTRQATSLDFSKETRLGRVAILPFDKTWPQRAELAAKVVDQVCVQDQAEPQGVQLPLSDAIDEDTGIGQIGALVTGNTVVRKKTVEANIRRTTYKYVPIIGTDGKPVQRQGRNLLRHEATGEYRIERVYFNCAGRINGVLEADSYFPGQSEPAKVRPARKDALRLAVPVVAGSVGEAELKTVCAIYAPAGK
jgi:hypothetical protein